MIEEGSAKMRDFFLAVAMLVLMAAISGVRSAEAGAATKHYVVTNNDVIGSNTVTFYLGGGTASAPALTRLKPSRQVARDWAADTSGWSGRCLSRTARMSAFLLRTVEAMTLPPSSSNLEKLWATTRGPAPIVTV